MKRFIVIFLYALCSTYIFAISVNVKPGLSYEIIDNTYRIEFYMPDYQIVTDTLSGDWGDALFSSIKPYDVDEFDYLHEDGRPTLPFYSLDLILPFGSFSCEVTSVQILDSTVVTLPYDYTPAQERVDFSDGFSFDEEYYNTHEEWYFTNYSIDNSNYRFYKGFKFSLFPCRYVAEIRQLTIVTRAVYEITVNGPDLVDYIQQELSEYDRLAYNFYDNIDVAVKYGNRMLLSDAICAAILLSAAIESSIENVKINLASIKNKDYAKKVDNEMKEIYTKSIERKQKILIDAANRM